MRTLVERTRRRRRLRLAGLALPLAVALVAAACGGGDSGDGVAAQPLELEQATLDPSDESPTADDVVGPEPPDPVQAAPSPLGAFGVVQEFDDNLTTPDQQHLTPGSAFDYPTIPPYGGPHDASPAQCGIYFQPLSFEALVHSMEHGAIIWYYQPDVLNTQDADAGYLLARELLNDNKRLIYLPDQRIEAPIVLASWGRLLPLDRFDAETIRDFVGKFDSEGPERLPRNIAC